jgi:hypothetical protein
MPLNAFAPDVSTISTIVPAPTGLVSCPGCHTVHPSLTRESLDAGDCWQCQRCGQQWNARRLATVEAYEAWCAEHNGPQP